MICIDLHEIRHYNNKLIADFLGDKEEKEFAVVIPLSIDKEDVNYSVFYQYALAAYAGEKLSAISESFGYYVPCPKRGGPIRFDFVTTNREALVTLLYALAEGIRLSAEEEGLQFYDEAIQYFSDYFDGRLKSVCSSLLVIAGDHLWKEDL
ncbi:MAG TPA: hypothetical protein VFV31_15045 [Chitinophagaceae bacterium]|nr:hypothetical protein [Chitinophagaceae bacterium]